MKALADLITTTLNLDIPHQIIDKPNSFQEIPLQEIDGTRFKNEFNFNFKSFEESIKETWEAMQ